MKAVEALIAWTPKGDSFDSETEGHIEIAPIGETDNWTHAFAYTGGAAWTQWRETTGSALLARLFIEFNTIVVRDGIDPQVAHAAFLTIDEYADTVAKDVPGEGSL